MAPDSFSDLEIIQGCIKKEKRSWDIFVERFSGLVWWAIQRSLEKTEFFGNSELAKDIFQGVFEKLIEKGELEKLRQTGSFKRFIVVMASNLSLDRVKAASRLQKREIPVEAPADWELTEKAPSAFWDEKRWVVSEVVDSLPRKERRCLELCYLENKTHQQISKILKLNQDTVSTIIRRAKEKLRQKLLEKGIYE